MLLNPPWNNLSRTLNQMPHAEKWGCTEKLRNNVTSILSTLTPPRPPLEATMTTLCVTIENIKREGKAKKHSKAKQDDARMKRRYDPA